MGSEAELLQQINKGLPEATQVRFSELKTKRDAATLTSNEHEELLGIIEQIEQLDSERLYMLAELAQLRGTSVRDLIHQLGIAPRCT